MVHAALVMAIAPGALSILVHYQTSLEIPSLLKSPITIFGTIIIVLGDLAGNRHGIPLQAGDDFLSGTAANEVDAIRDRTGCILSVRCDRHSHWSVTGDPKPGRPAKSVRDVVGRSLHNIFHARLTRRDHHCQSLRYRLWDIDTYHPPHAAIRHADGSACTGLFWQRRAAAGLCG